MTKAELYQMRTELLKKELNKYTILYLNSILDPSGKEELPNCEEKIVFIPKNQDVFIGTKLENKENEKTN